MQQLDWIPTYLQGRSRLLHLARILVGQVARLPEVALECSACIPIPWDHLSTNLRQYIKASWDVLQAPELLLVARQLVFGVEKRTM